MKHPLFSSYSEYLIQRSKRPATLSEFLNSSNWHENFPHSSLDEWEQAEMLGLFLKTKALLVTDPTFEEYSTREKILAIFYTWFEILGQEREFLTTLEKIQPWARTASLWNKVKPAFVDWIGEIIDEGVENREIAGRIVLSSWYKHVIWMQAMAILSSWLYDKSEEFARTDALIEKSITFLFDLIQPNALDSGWDLVSFFVKK